MKEDKKTLYALVRGIPNSFDQCIKPEVNPQSIDIRLARAQHRAYVDALSKLGCVVIMLPPNDQYPDCPFVEDTAVVLDSRALFTRPGAPSRRGEVTAVAEALGHFLELTFMDAPATLDGGDVLSVGNKIFVGRTARTNDAGIEALAAWAGNDYEIFPVPVGNALHLKSVVNYLNKETVVISGSGISPAVFSGLDVIEIGKAEAGLLSFLPINETVLIPSDCPETKRLFEERGFLTVPLDVSEIRKAQAGLTCMFILFET